VGIFRIKEETVKNQGLDTTKWRVFLCDSKGEPMDGYYTSFLADNIIPGINDIHTQQSIEDVQISTRYYDCESIRLEESSEGTTVIF
jgi:hypothetical protein